MDENDSRMSRILRKAKMRQQRNSTIVSPQDSRPTGGINNVLLPDSKSTSNIISSSAESRKIRKTIMENKRTQLHSDTDNNQNTPLSNPSQLCSETILLRGSVDKSILATPLSDITNYCSPRPFTGICINDEIHNTHSRGTSSALFSGRSSQQTQPPLSALTNENHPNMRGKYKMKQTSAINDVSQQLYNKFECASNIRSNNSGTVDNEASTNVTSLLSNNLTKEARSVRKTVLQNKRPAASPAEGSNKRISLPKKSKDINKNKKTMSKLEVFDKAMNCGGYHDHGDPTYSCSKCKAIFWYGERKDKSTQPRNPSFSNCCGDGKIVLPLLTQPPETLSKLLFGFDSRSKNYRENIRGYNSMFSFTSMGGKIDKAINSGGAPYVFKMKGANYHRIGSLLPQTGSIPKFSQLYIYDTQHEVRNRMTVMGSSAESSTEKFDPLNIIHIKVMLDKYNPLVKSFRTVKERGIVDDQEHSIRLKLIGERGSDGRTKNLPTADEVAALIPGDFDDNYQKRDIILETRSGKLQRISELHPSYLALQYPLLFPYGEDGYRLGIKHSDFSMKTTSKIRDKLTMKEFFAFRIHERDEEPKTIVFSRRLFQQFLVDAFTMVESERITFVRCNQVLLRSDKFINLDTAASQGQTSASATGKRVLLPTSFTGGARYMMQNYRDAMAICKCYGYPDLFITITCNPKWPEIKRFLDSRGLKAEDRPDIVTRIFKVKLDEIIKDMRDNKIFGEIRAVIYTVEFQKRGLPHAHILLFLSRERKIPTPEEVDDIISAEIPDEQTYPKLHELVTQNMIHGPCTNAYGSGCLKKGKCSKNFPKPYVDRTTVDEDGFPIYKRRDNEMFCDKNRHNGYVVSYSPVLLLKYQAHINVEWCNQFKSVKYLFKYINKGHDRVTVSIYENGDGNAEQENIIDEIKNYYNCRYVSPCEAVWRILGFKIHYRNPAVIRLSFHLPDEQPCFYNDDDLIDQVVVEEKDKKSMFLAWMECNKSCPKARTVTYPEFPTEFVWNSTKRYWSIRKGRTNTIGRLDYVPPGLGEAYYLSLMLHHSAGATSYEDIRTIDNVVYPSFKDACYKLQLLGDDREYVDGIIEASTWGMPQFLRNLFASLILSSSISRPEFVWEQTWKYLADDILFRQRKLLQIPDLHLTDESLKNFTLIELEKILHRNGRSLKSFNGMPLPDDSMMNDGNNKLIQQELNFDKSTLHAEHEKLYPLLTSEQKSVYEEILAATNTDKGGFYFVYGYGGTGKTFIWRTLSAALRSKGEIVLNVASSGVASLLLPAGRTAHSRFGIPLNVFENCSCSITSGSELAGLIERSKLIIWDEAPMMSKYCLEALHNSFKDLAPEERKHLPFAGKVVLLGGDFRQILPVIPRGSREDVVYASICSSDLWSHCKILRLTKNMRLTVGQSLTESVALEIKEFSEWILKIGDGDIGTEVDGQTFIDIPDDILLRTDGDHVAAIVESTYPSILNNFGNQSFFEERAILAPTNRVVESVNEYVMSLIPGDEKIYLSHDTICKSYVDGKPENPVYSTDFLNSIKCSGMPNHVLKLKVGVPVMLIRNMDQSNGLCNGTRLFVTQLGERIIEGRIISGNNIGKKAYIPRMVLSPSDSRLPFQFQRRQFPLILCFAMTINKSQGQTLSQVGLYLPKPVFSHGQLYVALSRVTSRKGLKILCCDDDGNIVNKTTNVVYKEVFQNLK